MRTYAIMQHSEATDVRRLPDNVDAGYGPSYVSSAYGRDIWIAAYIDSHWPAIYAFRCDSDEEAFEHAEVVLCPIDDEAEAVCALIESWFGRGDASWDAIDSYLSSTDSRIAADGRVRHTAPLSMQRVRWEDLIERMRENRREYGLRAI